MKKSPSGAIFLLFSATAGLDFRSIEARAPQRRVTHTEDERIIELFFQRDEAAVAATRAAYGGRLRRLAYAILGDEGAAEECENDVYLAAWRTIPPQKPRYLFAYLAKIGRNAAFHRLEYKKAEKRGAETVALTEELAACIPDGRAQRAYEAGELAALISGFLRTQSYDARVIFVRRYFAAEPVREIAAALGVSDSRVKSSLFRTRQKLRDYLTKEGVIV